MTPVLGSDGVLHPKRTNGPRLAPDTRGSGGMPSRSFTRAQPRRTPPRPDLLQKRSREEGQTTDPPFDRVVSAYITNGKILTSWTPGLSDSLECSLRIEPTFVPRRLDVFDTRTGESV